MGTAVQAGDLIEDFTLDDQDGNPRSLAELCENGPVVLFFYPAAMTRGCTAEACHFRDVGAEFAELGAQRVGISRDAVAKQKEFADQNGFDYPLLSDPDGTVAARFGVRRKLNLGALSTRRMTFVIGPDRRVMGAVHSEVSMTGHADQALEILRGE